MRTTLISIVLVYLISIPCLSPGHAAGEMAVTLSNEFRSVDSPLQKDILERRTLHVGFNVGYEPFEMIDRQGRFIGFDIDLAKELAQAMGVRLVLIEYAWEGLIPGLLNKKFDLLLSSMTVTAERARLVDFSNPYFVAGQTILLHKKHTGRVNSYRDLNRASFIVTSKSGTAGERAVKRWIPNSRYEAFQFETEAAAQVLTGRADAFVYNLPFCARYMAQLGKDRLIFLDRPITQEPYGIALRKGDPEIRAWLNRFLRQIKNDGRYAQIYNRWILQDYWRRQSGK